MTLANERASSYLERHTNAKWDLWTRNVRAGRPATQLCFIYFQISGTINKENIESGQEQQRIRPTCTMPARVYRCLLTVVNDWSDARVRIPGFTVRSHLLYLNEPITHGWLNLNPVNFVISRHSRTPNSRLTLVNKLHILNGMQRVCDSTRTNKMSRMAMVRMSCYKNTRDYANMNQ